MMKKEQKRYIKDSEVRKYKIQECLLKLNATNHQIAVRRLHKVMGISLNTFHNYRNILINDPQDIPHEKVIMFEQIFGIAGGELINKVIQMKPLDHILKGERL